MEPKKELIFQIDSPLVVDYYQNHKNYKIVYNDSENCDKSLCAIYFSSNELYYPNTEKAFKMSIAERDKFEWQRSKVERAYKHIFFRDIQKQWYIEGINAEVNSPEKLKELILKETEGYKIEAFGSSAGGYAALVYGSLVNANEIYAFNPQFDLKIVVKKSTPAIDPLLFKYKDQPQGKYFEVDYFLNEQSEYFYFQSAKSPMEKEQYGSIAKKSVINRIQFNTSHHGFPFLRHDLKYVLSLSSSDLKQMKEKVISPFRFSVEVDGFFNTVAIVVKTVMKRMKKKLYVEVKNR